MKPSDKIIGVTPPPLAVPSYLQNWGAQSCLDAIRKLEEIDPARIQCLEFRVLLKVLGVESMTQGGIYRQTSDVERELFSKCSAQIVNMGEESFRRPDGSPVANRPKPGDFVVTAKYSGITVRDAQNNLYRFANDEDVVSIIKGEKE